MAEKIMKRAGLGRWLALAIAGCVLLPIVSIAWMGLGGDGARWAQTELTRMRSPKAGDSIRIRKTALGGYMANINDRPAIRVKREN